MSVQNDFHQLRRRHFKHDSKGKPLSEAAWNKNEVQKALESEIFNFLEMQTSGRDAWVMVLGQDELGIHVDRRGRVKVSQYRDDDDPLQYSFQLALR